MLRDWTYASKEMHRVLEQFQGINLKATPYTYAEITAYKLLSPDSFLWRLVIDKEVYYLYAEDYIPSMEHVRRQVKEATNSVSGEFVAVKKPDLGNKVNNPPDGWVEIAKHSVDSGNDSVFLFKVTKNTISKKSVGS